MFKSRHHSSAFWLQKVRERLLFSSETLVNFVYPLSCLSCRKSIKRLFSFSFCRTCFRRLVFVGESACIQCGRPYSPSSYKKMFFVCRECIDAENAFDLSLSSLCLTEPLKKSVYSFKYQRRKHYGYYFAAFMAVKLKRSFPERSFEDYLVVPVPLHALKKKERGYNQSEILAKHLGERLSLKVSEHILKRHAFTLSQTALDKHRRKKNICDAFIMEKKADIKNKRILLIDDVMTTGATLNECSRVLKKHGAKEVVGLTLASVPLLS